MPHSTSIPALSVHDLRRLRQAGEDIVLLDVREPVEWGRCRIEPSLHMPVGELAARVTELDPGRRYAVLCHHGVRSARAVAFLRGRDFDAVNVTGGIHAWSRDIDPAVPTY